MILTASILIALSSTQAVNRFEPFTPLPVSSKHNQINDASPDLTKTAVNRSGKQKKLKAFVEIPQHIQVDGLYAPEVGRIGPASASGKVIVKPEMDMDPREPILVPSPAEMLPVTDDDVAV